MGKPWPHGWVKGAWASRRRYTALASKGYPPATLCRYMEAAAAEHVEAARVLRNGAEALKRPERHRRPMCRDCADNNGTCPIDGTPCDPRTPIRIRAHDQDQEESGR